MGVEIPVATRKPSVQVNNGDTPVNVEALNFIGSEPIPVLHLVDIGSQI